MRSFFLFTLIVSVAIHFSAAQIVFTASAPKSIPENQNFNLTYTIQNATGKNLTLPALNDFTIVGGPSSSTSMQIINGSVTQSASYTYLLRPKHQGTFKIGAATIEVNGNTLESNELSIQVTAPSAQSQSQQATPYNQHSNKQSQNNEDLANQLKDDVFVKVILSKNSVYKGELLSATYKLYFRANLNGFNLTKAPSLEGFWSKEIELDPKRKQKVENYNGRQYYAIDILKYNLYPQRAGTLQISPAEISTTAQVTVKSAAKDPFNDPFFSDPFADFFGQTKNVPLTLKTVTINVNVKELPDNGKPKDFTGAVGKFNFETSLSAEESKTDDPVTYTVKISGTGNLNLIDAPIVQLPNGFEVYDPKVKENIRNGEGGTSGSKQYDYLMIPRLPGEYKIGGQVFSYFDPSSEKYITINAPEFSLKIAGEPSKNANANSSNYVTQQNVSLLGEDIRYIKTSVPSFNQNQKSFFGLGGFIALYSFPFLAFIALIAVRRRNENLAADIVGSRRRRALKLAKRRLRLAEKNLEIRNKKNFYDEVSRAIWGYLADKLNIDMSDLSKDTVAEKLFARNVKQETIAKLQSLLNSCEMSLYAPSSEAEMKDDYTAALNLIADLEDEIKTKPGIIPIAKVTAMFLMLAFSFASFAQSTAEIYNHGNESYKLKHFREAADDYEKLLAQNYKSEEVYYNLGNCYFKMDSVGRSILSYERALQYSPKDEDIIYNLKLARQKAVDNIQPVPQLAVITWWNNFVSYNDSRGWGITAIALVWFALLLFIIGFFTGRKRLLNSLAIFILLISFGTIPLASMQQHDEMNSDSAIVMASSSYIKSAPDATASDLFIIHEGARIQLLDHVGEWNKIRLEDGKVGWMENGMFEKI